MKKEKEEKNIKMTRHRNNIVMMKRQTPKRVELHNGRVFYKKYKRVDKNLLPANIRIRKTYRGNPTQGRRPKVRARAIPVHVVRWRGFGKIFNFVKKVSKSPLARKIGKGAHRELSNVYNKVTNKIPNKKLKCILQSDTANCLVHSAAAYGHSNL